MENVASQPRVRALPRPYARFSRGLTHALGIDRHTGVEACIVFDDVVA